MPTTGRETPPEVPAVYPPVPAATDVVRVPRPVLWLFVALVAALCWIAWEVRAMRLGAERTRTLEEMQEHDRIHRNR